MSGTERNNSIGNGDTASKKRLGLVVATVAAMLLMACNTGGDHKTPHPPVNPAMSGSPSESDHTNADPADLRGGYGTGTDAGAVKDDNIERTQGSPIPLPAADTAANAAPKK